MLLAAVLASGLLGACSSYKPYEYQDDREQMQGPGLFSGEDGVFTIYGQKRPEEGTAAGDKTEGSEKKDGERDKKESR